VREDNRIGVSPKSCGKEMSGPAHESTGMNEGSRGSEVMFAEHFPVIGHPPPPGPELSWSVLPTFLDPTVRIKTPSGGFAVVPLPLPVQ